MAVAVRSARVNIRMEQELYDVYATAARLLGVSVPDLMREILQEGLEPLQGLIAVAERARAGDREAAAQLVETMMASQERKLEALRAEAGPVVADVAERLRAGEGADVAERLAGQAGGGTSQ